MANPLEPFLPVKDTAEGVFIVVTPQEGARIPLDMIFDALDTALVINYDPERIRKAFEAAAGVPERIGPPFEYFDPALEQFVDLQVTEKKAELRIHSIVKENRVKLSVGAILFLLRRKGVVFGIKPDVIGEVLEKRGYDTDVIVAQWQAPFDGEDARLELQIEVSTDTRPRLKEDGSVDFREIHSFTQVSQGQIIARKIPPGTGTPGTTLSGKAVPATPGRDLAVKPGLNTHVSEDGSCLLASKAGVIKQEGGIINVLEMLTIAKDVDYHVGNIKYSGNLVINGSVMPGFTVESDGDIEIRGMVESAWVCSRNGTVTIHQGVLGKGDTEVLGKKGITVHFGQGAKLSSDGPIVVEKHLLHCTCRCESLEMGHHGSSVVGGEVRAYSHMRLRQCGNELGVETRLILADKVREAAEEKLRELEALEKKIVEKFEPVKRQVQTKAAILKKAGSVISERQRLEMKKWVDEYNSLQAKLKYVEQKLVEVKTTLAAESTGDGSIQVSGDVYPGVVLNLYGTTRVIRNRMTAKVFRSVMGTVDDGATS